MMTGIKLKDMMLKGFRHSNETKEKMRIKKVGKKFSIEHKEKLRRAHIGKQPMLGKKHSEETKQKIREKRKLQIMKNVGIKNYFWCGGIFKNPYPKNWTETLKRSIRERDNYICRMPGCGKLQGDKAFDVHHIDYDKKNCNPDNLITLCHECHVKTNHNRSYWIEYFKNLLI